MKHHFLLLLSLALLPLPARAAVSFAPIFSDGAVLQCEMKVNLWGTALPGADVEVTVDGATAATATADAAGRWQTTLEPRKPGGPHVIRAKSGKEAAQLGEVWFGEVWFASGQSNMAMALKNTTGGPETLARSEPCIRFVIIPLRATPPGQRAPRAGHLRWASFEPARSQRFSAVAFHFADRLRADTARKIGIIQSAVGGSPAQAWTPLATLEAVPELRHYAREAGHLAQQEEVQAPAALFENMIRPAIPYTARGVIWYQGEANAGKPQEYRALFPAMIAAWRSAWNLPDWPFLFVQLAGFDGRRNQDWPELRAAQAATRDSVPHTGMAVAIDCGDRNNVHPPDKKTVGHRLALLALDQVYKKDVLSRGPLAKRFGMADGKWLLHFDHVGAGLKTSDGSKEVPAFEVAGADNIFHKARATIVGADTIAISCEMVPKPSAVRYAWSNWVEPPVTLQNSGGLPAEPFRIQTSADEGRVSANLPRFAGSLFPLPCLSDESTVGQGKGEKR